MEISVPSFLLAEPSRDLVASARQEITRAWWRRDHARFEIFVSEITIEEAAQGDPRAAAKRLEFLEPLAVLRMRPEVRQTTELYFHRRIVP